MIDRESCKRELLVLALKITYSLLWTMIVLVYLQCNRKEKVVLKKTSPESGKSFEWVNTSGPEFILHN